MTSGIKNQKKDRTCFYVMLITWVLAILGLIWVVSFNISVFRSASLEARARQREKAREVENLITNYCSVATQLADTVQVFIENYQGRDRKQVEKYLDLFLASAPADIIHGTGIWWEAYAFDPAIKDFGSYAYWQKPGLQRNISYEWRPDHYDYHKLFWSRSGYAQSKAAYITEPYRDKAGTYISLVKPFFDTQTWQRKGLISVDMITSQLQSMLARIDSNPSELIIIVSKSGRILAHSQLEGLVEKSRRLHADRKIDSLVDVQLADTLVGLEDHLTYSHFLPTIGWTVVVVSKPDEIFSSYHQIRKVLALGTMIYLLILLLGYFTIRYFLRSLERQRESFLYTEKMASLGEMAGSIAHEINNPLAIIQGAAQKLQIKLQKDEINRDDLKHTSSMILKTADRIAKIVRSLRFVARDGSLDPFVSTNVRSIVDETMALCEARLKRDDIQIETSKVPGNLYCICRGVQISQVLINLINNSGDAICELNEKWIRIEASAEKEWIQITVTDSGSGIPKELADKIMKPFFTTKAVGKGTGLGLSISRGIAQEHGGDLILDSASPHTRFILSLPLANERLQSAKSKG